MSKTQDAAVERVRPLNQTQTKNLLALVKNDFQILREEIQAMMFRKLHQELAEADAEDREERKLEYIELANEISKKHNEEMRVLAQAAKEEGITLSHSISNINSNAASDDALKKKRERIQNLNSRDTEMAMKLLRTEQSKVERKVLVASVTTDAEDVLNTLPSAEDMLTKAYEEAQSTQAQLGTNVVWFQGMWMRKDAARRAGWKE